MTTKSDIDKLRSAAVTDMQKLRAAFREFRALGYFARSSQEDGWAAVPEDILRRTGKVVFWHANETDVAFDSSGNLRSPLHLHHLVRDTSEVQRVLTQHDLKTEVRPMKNEPAVVVLPNSGTELSTTLAVQTMLRRRLTVSFKPSFNIVFTVSAVEPDGESLRLVAHSHANTWISLPATTLAEAFNKGYIEETQ